MSPSRVLVAAPSEAVDVVNVLTLAFSTDPMARWTLSDARKYLEVWPAIVRAFGGRALESESAHYVEGFAGAALWLPPGVEPDQGALEALVQEHVEANLLQEVGGVFEEMARFHPTEPHWYLPLIGVDPFQQGRGHGAALLRHAVARFDRDGVTAYLESSNPRNVPLYLRHGFEPIGSIQVGSSPTMVPMLRRPR